MEHAVRVMDYDIFSGNLNEIEWEDKKPMVINTINAYSYVVASRDDSFKKALQESDILLPDGFPLVFAAKFLEGKKIQKVAGADIFKSMCERMNEKAGSCFFLGSSKSTLEKIKIRLRKDYPKIRAGFYSPPFKKEFSLEDNNKMMEIIKNFHPDVLFVGMTAPKQEKWASSQKKAIQAGVICSIGAVFDFYAGTTLRPAPFWIKNNLEWFIRLLKEPRRLWKRYLIYSPLFFLSMLRYKLKRR